jgi:hypothetical protein
MPSNKETLKQQKIKSSLDYELNDLLPCAFVLPLLRFLLEVITRGRAVNLHFEAINKAIIAMNLPLIAEFIP